MLPKKPKGVTQSNTNGRTIIIGDLHGCVIEAQDLLNKCNVKNNDNVIFLGDLIDRGPDNDECINLAMHYQKKQGQYAAILGNHESRHLQYHYDELKGKNVEIFSESHLATRKQLKQKHYDYMTDLPSYIKLPEHNVICVHAGMFPGRKIEDQCFKHLLHTQMIKPYGHDGLPSGNESSCWPSKVPDETGWGFWTKFWKGPERIVFGHSVLTQPLISDFAVGIDGGCCFGLELWALILPEWKIVKVKSTLKNTDKQKRLLNIGNNVFTY